MANGDLAMLVLGVGSVIGFHYFARWAERDHQQQLQREALSDRNVARDLLAWEQSAMKDKPRGKNG